MSHYCPSGVSADQNGHLRIIPGYNPSSGIAPPHNPSSRARAAQNPPKMLGPLGNCGGQGSKYLLKDKKLGSFRLYVETTDLKPYGFKWCYSKAFEARNLTGLLIIGDQFEQEVVE